MDLEFRKWASKIGNCNILGLPIFQGRPQYTQFTTIYIYLLLMSLRYVYVFGNMSQNLILRVWKVSA